MNGVNQATFFILPMLGEKHPEEYPRFRDCFLNMEGNEPIIEVYTRVGGGNRGCGYGEEELREHPNFLYDEDDESDSTYATYAFSIPEEFKADFELLKNGDMAGTSEKYKQRVLKTFPKAGEKLRAILYQIPTTN